MLSFENSHFSENLCNDGESLSLLPLDNLNLPLEMSVEEEDCSEIQKAPSDLEQIKEISDSLLDIKNLRFENWIELCISDRLSVLQEAEYKIAEIEHRNPCEILVQDLPENLCGQFVQENQIIILNSKYVGRNDMEGYMETLDTLVHEGRHAYQDYNMYEREVHPRTGEVNIWKWNENDIGYQTVSLCGFEAYAMQPVETDARAFAEDVLNSYFEKIA